MAASSRRVSRRIRAATALLEEVVVTARKREELAQDVPLSVSAFDSAKTEALKVRDLQRLSVSMPNVALDDIGTFPRTANFSIRGLGINSSIPSIDPTVGIFVDGVYMANNLGVMMDTFDLENTQVLRGPQGTLFGRNVTGGAVLVNTRKPGDTFEFAMKGAMDSNPDGDGGLNSYLMASVGGPLVEPIFRTRSEAGALLRHVALEVGEDGLEFGVVADRGKIGIEVAVRLAHPRHHQTHQ